MRTSTLLQTLLTASLSVAFEASHGSAVPAKYEPKPPPLDTPWTSQVGINPWPEYPRPKLARSQWQSLNGIWQYQNATSLDAVNNPPFNQTLSQDVLVPFCLESGLSGVQGEYALYSWYSTSFDVPANWTGDRVLLNFNAVDYEATVFVNGNKVAFSRGGYFAFSVDVTKYLTPGKSNELIVFVHDPTDSDPYVIPIGKQTLRPSHIFYRPCSGIWQSVWLESAPTNHISQLDVNGDADGNVNITITASQSNSTEVQIIVTERDSNQVVASHTGDAGNMINFQVNSPKLWSPDTPHLYDITIKLGEDEIKTYTGFRSIMRESVNNVQRIMLNGRPFFPFGTLDQGYWPDGLHTPPTYDAMVYDIKTLKKIGFNTLRKHIKVESPLFYQAADELGILVMQDMPALRPSQEHTLPNCTRVTILPDPEQQQEFQRQLGVMINQFKSYTSIFAWVIYNEGWAQITDYYPEFQLTDFVRQLDPTRLVNANSGWFDHGAGDFSDNHHYANPQCGTPWYSTQSSPFDSKRIGFQGEFGGTGHNLSADHLWKVAQAINGINQTYELDGNLSVWNARGHFLLEELRSQVELYSCAGGIWTQTTDVEGEVNGMLSYDRRVLRPDIMQWQQDIQALYDTAARRSNASMPGLT